MLRELGIRGIRVDVSSVCNMNCEYCFIPKSKVMRKLQIDVFNSLDKAEKWLKEASSLTLWGAEPAFGLIRVADILQSGDYYFNEIYFATNMTVSPKIYLQALKKFNGKTRKVRLQVSLDGYKEMHERTRGKTWDRIVNNTKELVRAMNDVDISYELNIKFNTVVDANSIAWLAEDLARVDKWYQFFDEFVGELESISTNPNVKIGKPLSPNIAVPGKYTKQDGINFAKVVRRYIDNGYTFGQFYRFVQLLKRPTDAIDKANKGNASCGAVFGSIGYDRGTFHPCHRTYWLQDDEYVEDVIKNYEDWWTSRADRATIENVRRHIVSEDDEYRLKRMLYTLGATQIYPQLSFNYSYAMVKMLAKAGLISKIYLEKDWLARLLALYTAMGIRCVMENWIVTGSVHITPASYFKLLGNGAFELLVEHHKKEVLGAWRKAYSK